MASVGHRADAQAKALAAGPRPGCGRKAQYGQSARCCAGPADSVLWTDSPLPAGAWLSVQSLIQEASPSIPGQALCWGLAQRPSHDPAPGPVTRWRGHTCHDCLVCNLQ